MDEIMRGLLSIAKKAKIRLLLDHKLRNSVLIIPYENTEFTNGVRKICTFPEQLLTGIPKI
jgi:hypothetical protein